MLARLGRLIDLSAHLRRREGTDRALAVCDELSQRSLRSDQRALLHYFSANAWHNRWQMEGCGLRSWEQWELEHEILELRLAVGHANALPGIRRCQVFTNMGNALSRAGRFIEAIHSYDYALIIENEFAMAIGNRAVELAWYARLVPQRHDRIVLFQESYVDLQRARSLPLTGDASGAFAKCQATVESLVPVAVLLHRHDLSRGNLGRSRDEQLYRRWCLTHRLFLHPVNDLGAFSSAATDPISLPAVCVPLGEGPNLLGFFNQLKQEFASARYMLFAGIQRNRVHFADRGVRLTNTLDYPSYSLATEQVKVSFRVAYSVFDKIGFFLNE